MFSCLGKNICIYIMKMMNLLDSIIAKMQREIYVDDFFFFYFIKSAVPMVDS